MSYNDYPGENPYPSGKEEMERPTEKIAQHEDCPYFLPAEQIAEIFKDFLNEEREEQL